jgi:two-component system, NarL family, response regulator NreC
MSDRIRVLVADDHAILRSGLRMLIGAEPDMEVVGEAADLAETIRLARSLEPGVVTLDLSMPGSTGLASIEKLRAAAPASRIVVLTMHDDAAYVRNALALGATGYLAKSAADATLIRAIRAVARGGLFVDVNDADAAATAAQTSPAAGGASPLATLSAREREVLERVALGHTNREIAQQLSLSVKTVEGYRSRVMSKLGLTSRADLTRVAIELGLLAPQSS